MCIFMSPFPILLNTPIQLSPFSFKFIASFIINCCCMNICIYVCICIFVFLYIHIPNITFSFCTMLYVYMFSWLIIWYWKTIGVFFPRKDYFSHSAFLSNSWCRTETFRHISCHPCLVHGWAVMFVILYRYCFRHTGRHDVSENSMIFCPLQSFCLIFCNVFSRVQVI